jgi:drug/metabolite transporter (DMT)-like permease
MWQVALGIFFVFFVAQTLVKRNLALISDIPETIPPFISYVFGIMPIGLIVGLAMEHTVHWSPWTLLLLALEGSFIALFNWVSFRALRHLPAAHFQTVFQVNTIVIITLGWILLGETLSGMQIIGAACILCGALLAIWAPVRAHMRGGTHIPRLKAGLVLTLISAIVMGVGLVAEKAALQYMDLGAYFIFGFAAQGLFMGALALPSLVSHPLRTIPRHIIRQSTLFGLISVGMGFTYLFALQKSNNISLITALKAFALPLTAIAAHYILKERDDNKLLWAAIALAIIGIGITAQ